MSEFSNRWQEIFDKYDIAKRVEKDGYADISANEIKKLHFEPRLLTKIDHSIHLPPVMADSNLSILTLSSSSWRIGSFEIFEKLPEWNTNAPVENKNLPDWIQSINPEKITGEGAVVNSAQISGILDSFCENELQLTISGKARSGDFDFSVNSKFGKAIIEVRGAQIEIDAGYETRDDIWIIEAKKRKSLDFNVRQLYYPFRAWQQKIAKPIRTVYLTFANDYYDLYEYGFEDANEMSSIQLLKKSRFTVNAVPVSKNELVEIAQASLGKKNKVPEVPFPQADDFERVLDLLEFLAESPRSQEDITTKYEFAPRQSDYYFNACRYLGVAEKSGSGIRKATTLGSKIAELDYKKKRIELAKLLFAIEPIPEIYLASVKGSPLTNDDVTKIFEKSTSSNGISGSTIGRRTQTIQSWVRWLVDLGV